MSGSRIPTARVAVVAALALAAVAFIALLAYGLVAKAPGTDIDDSLARGEAAPAPGFALPLLAGTPAGGLPRAVDRAATDGAVELTELAGTPVVLNFWASWCAPCRDEAPVLERAWRNSQDGGPLFLGLNQQDLTDDARGFADEFGLSYPSMRDQSDAVGREWGVTGLPETFFVSARGEVVGHVIGAISREQLRDGMEAAESGTPLGPLTGGDRRAIR